MKLKELNLKGAYEISLHAFEDLRGDFVKIFHAGNFKQHGLHHDFKESYYSTSKRGVIRGMHFQTPPFHHSKLVYAAEGEVLDVLLDLRKNSPTYLQHCTVELSKQNRNAVYIPAGLAHGFAVTTESATLVYMATTVYHKESDTGVLWNSFGFNWPVENPLISERDQSFMQLKEFESPFNYQ